MLVGIFAGYVNGNINNCGVHYSKIEIANKTQYYLTNDETVNGYINKNISNYTLLGAYNNASYYWDGEPGFSEGGNDFGGSIDIYNLSKRILKINSRTDTVVKTWPQSFGYYSQYTNANFNTKIVSNIATINAYDKAKSMSLNDGTFLPLNVDVSKIENYDNSSLISNEYILSNNTGYIVGSGDNQNPGGGIKIQHLKYGEFPQNNNLSNFFLKEKDQSGKEREPTEIKSSNVAFSYWDQKNKKTIRIKDKDNDTLLSDTDSIGSTDKALSRYEDVKKDIIELLQNNKTINAKFASPLLFFNKTTNLNKSNIVTLNKAFICGSEPKTNYQMYKGGINFTLTKAGRVTFVMPTIRNSSNDEIFNLYKVTRNENHQITGNKELTDVLPSTKNGLERNRIYYCEIPLEKGDYFLGAANGNTPYFMYLDIGSSSSSTAETRTALTNVDFVDKVEESGEMVLKKVDPTNLSKVAFKISGTFDSNYIYYFRRKGNTVYYYSSVPAFRFITPSSTGEKKEASGEACES